ncbi:MAG TPA: class II glutamine amidotransferase [Solirubrobacteraceae bacterium]
MCRLFGMSGGPEPVRATFWLLEAPDSLSQQSRREPDGTGIGTYREGRAVIEKQVLAAYEDQDFGREARQLQSRTFVAHVRYASNGGLELKNTHPFEQDGRIFAHNGVLGDVGRLEAELGPAISQVHGDTDSERWFALITREIERADGDVGAGITVAARWVAANLPLLSVNFILIDSDELWALRYPDTHELHVLERDAGGHTGERSLEHRSRRGRGRIHVNSEELGDRPAVIVATEPMDEDPGWRELRSGELLHVDPQLGVHTELVVDSAPAHLLTLADLDPRAAASQQPATR